MMGYGTSILTRRLSLRVCFGWYRALDGHFRRLGPGLRRRKPELVYGMELDKESRMESESSNLVLILKGVWLVTGGFFEL